MSTILNALKRLENEHPETPGPMQAASWLAPPAVHSSVKDRLLQVIPGRGRMFLAAALVLAAAGAAIWSLNKMPPEERHQAPAATGPQPTAAGPETQPTAAGAEAQPAAAARKDAPPRRSRTMKAEGAGISASAASKKASLPAQRQPKTRERRAEPAPGRRPETAAPAAGAPQANEAETFPSPVRRQAGAAAAVPEAGAGKEAVRREMETSAAAYPTLPNESGIRLQAISWSKAPERRIVVINGRILRQGEGIDGYTVSEINPDDVVFDRSGRRWRLAFKTR